MISIVSEPYHFRSVSYIVLPSEVSFFFVSVLLVLLIVIGEVKETPICMLPGLLNPTSLSRIKIKGKVYVIVN